MIIAHGGPRFHRARAKRVHGLRRLRYQDSGSIRVVSEEGAPGTSRGS